MSREFPTTIDAETPFAVDELFFSRTDARGIIAASNNIFCRLAEYECAELKGAPHKIVRHPDMPRAVFQLLWASLQAGQPVGAYVKNRTKSGRYYWVFAVATPLAAGGYLSVRLKPTSELLPRVSALYAKIRKTELDTGMQPEASAALLLQGLKALGFDDYQSFMATALAREVQARDTALGHSGDPGITRLQNMAERIIEARGEAATIKSAVEAVRTIPYNLRIQASRLGDLAGPVGVIASNHGALSAEILTGVDALLATLEAACTNIFDGLFIACTARLQADVISAFEAEARGEGNPAVDYLTEMTHLRSQRGHGAQARSELQGILRQISRFADACSQMRRVVTGLNVTRVMCKVESGRLLHRESSLDEIISRLGGFQDAMTAYLEHTDHVIEEIRHDADAQISLLTSPRAA